MIHLENPHAVAGPYTLLADANKNGWVIISMKNDWKRVFDIGK